MSVSAFAQLAVQEPQAAYEGENVSAVALIANPHRDLALLLPLVEQKAGAPYSHVAIENTAKAMPASRMLPPTFSVKAEYIGTSMDSAKVVRKLIFRSTRASRETDFNIIEA